MDRQAAHLPCRMAGCSLVRGLQPNLSRRILLYAHEIGIQKIGFTTADPFLFLKERLLEAEALDLFTGFEHRCKVNYTSVQISSLSLEPNK